MKFVQQPDDYDPAGRTAQIRFRPLLRQLIEAHRFQDLTLFLRMNFILVSVIYKTRQRRHCSLSFEEKVQNWILNITGTATVALLVMSDLENGRNYRTLNTFQCLK